MKKLAYIILAVSALAAGLSACDSQKEQISATDAGVELRYRANDMYELAAVNPAPITIVVKSTKPWTVRSYNPDWCIIDHESGEAQPDSLVHVGKGENTTVRIQYYDNTQLDDRTDYIEIASDGWVGKKVVVNQKGSAYISVPEEEQKILLAKPGDEQSFHVYANQAWSAAITEIQGDWLTISEGATGEMDGVVTVTAAPNTAEMRYATVTLYDRHNKKVVDIAYTQDGVQLEPEDAAEEMKAEWNAPEATLKVFANTHWTVTKKDPSADWFDIATPEFTGDGEIKLTLQENPGTSIRSSIIVITTDPDENGFIVSHEIMIRQAYAIAAIKYMFDATELGNWTSDKGVDPVYQDGVGVLFSAVSEDKYARLNRSMAPGSYTFYWSHFQGEEVQARIWFCYSSGQEIKLYYEGTSLSLSFNQGNDASSPDKPAKTEGVTDGFDQSVGHAISLDFTQAGAFSHIVVSVDGEMAYEFTTSEKAISNCKWGAPINMYVGVDAGSAILEWYEFTPLFSWD